MPVRWPPGFTATFAPALVIHSPTGATVAKQGDAIPAGSWGSLFVCGTTVGVMGPAAAGALLQQHPVFIIAIELVEMGESRTPRPEPFAGDHYERVR